MGPRAKPNREEKLEAPGFSRGEDVTAGLPPLKGAIS